MNQRNSDQITFAVPFYANCEYLRRALASVVAQTYDNWQLIVVDDCSPAEGVAELVASFSDPRMRYVRNENNLGLAGNWNRCVDLTETPLVTLFHADDELLPGYARTLLDAHARWPSAAAISCGAEIMDARSKQIFSFRDWVKRRLRPISDKPCVLAGEEGTCRLLRGNFVMCPTLCYKRSLFAKVRFSPDWRFVLDIDLLLHALQAGEQLVDIPDVQYRYRRHAESATAQCERNLSMFQEEFHFWTQAAGVNRQRGWHRAARIAERMSIIKLQIGYYALMDFFHFHPRRALGTVRMLARTRRR